MSLTVSSEKTLLFAINLFALTLFTPIAQANDYLSELEAEANSIIDNNTSSQNTILDEELKLSDLQKSQVNEFEQTLKNDFPSTYKMYYIHLAPEKRLIVVENYFKNNKQMSSATKKLFSLYIKK